MLKIGVGFIIGCVVGLFVLAPGIRMIDQPTDTEKVADTCGMDGGAGCKIVDVADKGIPSPLPEHFVQGQIATPQQLTGKPSFLRRAGKYCAYCREKIPQAEKLLLEPFSGQINVQLFTMNFDTQKFDTLLPQVPFEIMTYESFTQESCDMFPTWVVLDSSGKLVSKECGGTGTIEEVATLIEGLLATN